MTRLSGTDTDASGLQTDVDHLDVAAEASRAWGGQIVVLRVPVVRTVRTSVLVAGSKYRDRSTGIEVSGSKYRDLSAETPCYQFTVA